MTELGDIVRSRLAAAADPGKAAAMQTYMKSAMPFIGISTVPLRQICKETFAGLAFADDASWQAAVLRLWREARFREERYCAIELAGIRSARPFQTIASLGMYEEMIVTGAWWDYVDAIATKRLWNLLTNEPGPMKQAMLAWSRDDDMWKRRSAIICQINANKATDLEFLYACIKPSMGSKEFFLRKAIGWALRQYARIDGDEVRRYVERHSSALSGLTRREALKRLPARADQ